MNKLIENAVMRSSTAMKKLKIKRKTKEIFPDNPVFDFTNDHMNKIKPKRKLSDDLSKWKDDDFLIYLKSKFKYCLITVSVYDRDKISRVKDKLTKGIRVSTSDKKRSCDNITLKSYLDWCINFFGSQLSSENKPVSSEVFCREDYARLFFESGTWIALKQSQLNSVPLKNTKRVQTTTKDNYRAGGLNKLIYDFGIIDSYYYLISEEKKTEKEALKEMRSVLSNLHEAVFIYIVEKTLKKCPYEEYKNLDVEKLIRPQFLKRGIKMFDSVKFNDMFVKETEK